MIPLVYDNSDFEELLLRSCYSSWIRPYGNPIDCVSAIVHEERNGEYFADLVVPVASRNFPLISLNNLILLDTSNLSRSADTYYMHKTQCFRISKISKAINGLVNVHCDHISYDLKYKPCPRDAEWIANTSREALKDIVEYTTTGLDNIFWAESNFDVNTPYLVKGMIPGSIRSYLGGQKGSLMDVYNTSTRGEYEWNNRLVYWWGQRGTDRGEQIVYGEDLSDFTLDEELAFFPNAAIGYAIYENNYGDYFKEYSNVVIKSGVTGDVRVIYVDFSSEFTEDEYDGSPQAQEAREQKLNTLTQNYVSSQLDGDEIDFNLKINFADLRNKTLDGKVFLCDTIRIVYPKYNFNAKAKMIAYDYDVLNEKYISIEVGKPKIYFENILTNKYADASVKKIQNFYK